MVESSELFAKALILGDDPTIGSRLRELESNIMQEMLLVPAMTLDIQYEQRDVLYGLRQNMSAMDYHMRESLLQGPDCTCFLSNPERSLQPRAHSRFL